MSSCCKSAASASGPSCTQWPFARARGFPFPPTKRHHQKLCTRKIRAKGLRENFRLRGPDSVTPHIPTTVHGRLRRKARKVMEPEVSRFDGSGSSRTHQGVGTTVGISSLPAHSRNLYPNSCPLVDQHSASL